MTARNYIIIIGAMKSGTTTLFDVLARHPAIAPASSKEPGFFAFEGVWNKGFDWFDTLFDFDPDQHSYRLEASTDYSKAPFVSGVWDRMTANPDVTVKLIYIMRNPLRRMESHARHVQATRKEIGQDISVMPDHSLDAGLSLLNLSVSHYASQLEVFEDARKSGNLHCLTLEELKSDPTTAIANMAEFLGLDAAGFGETAPTSNPASAKQQPSAFWKKLIRFPALMTLGRAVLPESLRARIRNSAHQAIVTEGRFAFTSAEEQALGNILADDLRRLEETYGIDVSRWWGPVPKSAAVASEGAQVASPLARQNANT